MEPDTPLTHFGKPSVAAVRRQLCGGVKANSPTRSEAPLW